MWKCTSTTSMNNSLASSTNPSTSKSAYSARRTYYECIVIIHPMVLNTLIVHSSSVFWQKSIHVFL
ncbi:hypothetical protein BDF19DRAFT_452230 [Syncephalis fuscata]|nr:hypothetical protein BDF19DRAFT_452230 [Syncephalis fuscata]